MPYSALKARLDAGDIVILDGGIGSELEKTGVSMDHQLWCGMAMETNPDLVTKVHESYLNAGAEVITANTYSTGRHALKLAGLGDRTDAWNRAAVRLARGAIDASGRDAVLAGSVSNFASWDGLNADQMRASFAEQGRILVDEGVDLIILETLASPPDVVRAITEETQDLEVPVWLAMSVKADDDTGAIMHGQEEHKDYSKNPVGYQPFEDMIAAVSDCGVEAMLMMHSQRQVTKAAVEILAANFDGPIGAYPNAGYWKRPEWVFVDDLTPEVYAAEAQSWIAAGARIVGGCCGVGPEHIAAVRSVVHP